MQDHLIGNCNPFTVDFHLVVIVNGAYRGRSAIPEIATKEAVGAFQPPVKGLMPFLVVMSKMSFLCDYSVRPKTEYGCEDFVHSKLYEGPVTLWSMKLGNAKRSSMTLAPRQNYRVGALARHRAGAAVGARSQYRNFCRDRPARCGSPRGRDAAGKDNVWLAGRDRRWFCDRHSHHWALTLDRLLLRPA